MVDFDPKYLGEYRPQDVFELAHLANVIARERKTGRLLAWMECIQSDIYSEEEINEINELIDWDQSQEIIVTEYVWKELRESLVDGIIELIAVDDYEVKRNIDRKFWATNIAPQVLSAGYIDLPMYEPKGKVYATLDDLNTIAYHHRERWYMHYDNVEFFKINSPSDWKEKLARWRADLSEQHRAMITEEQNVVVSKSRRGRRPTFNLDLF